MTEITSQYIRSELAFGQLPLNARELRATAPAVYTAAARAQTAEETLRGYLHAARNSLEQALQAIDFGNTINQHGVLQTTGQQVDTQAAVLHTTRLVLDEALQAHRETTATAG